MNKKKTSKKHEISLVDIPRFDIHDEKKFSEFKAKDFFKNHQNVGMALLQALIENDTESYIEILDSYLRINESHTDFKPCFF